MIVITGASSGIGAALAREYARDGAALALAGRDRARLDGLAAECRALGAAEVRIAALDVRDRAAMRGWLEEIAAGGPVEFVIANAGLLTGTPPDALVEPADAAYRVMETNALGVLNTVQPVLAGMLARGSGRIVLVASIAAFTPIADMPSYAASKAAILSYGLSLRAALAPHGVHVSVVCPGFIDTAMTDQISGDKPFMISAEDAARRIRRGIARNRAVIAFPFLFAAMTRICGLLPDPLRRWSARNYRLTVAPRE
ncbi:MAG TPA: SDR family NAD(P)-dependent oxidoreductase [Stellaceae bacterium]|nr:SDR family NAD(P)-dependent oxidoreductase [Stellaceae bacterium]